MTKTSPFPPNIAEYIRKREILFADEKKKREEHDSKQFNEINGNKNI